MAYIAPFRALRYDPRRVNLGKVVTQPYDKISLQMQDQYYDADPHNLVRIILGKRQETDTAQNNVYTRAAEFFHDWRRQGIFVQDKQASFYAYSQQFTVPGSRTVLERRGFIGLGHIEDYSAGVVFRHEQTLAKPKADRLELLRATRAHFGQLFMIYSGKREIENLLKTEQPANIEIRDEYGVQHRVWRVSDPRLVNLIAEKMRDKKLMIADGHHRYETALSYRNEQRAALKAAVASGGSPSMGARSASTDVEETQSTPQDFVMMTFIDMDSPGLLILPTHRVVRGLAYFSPERFARDARQYFEVVDVAPSEAIAGDRATETLDQAGQQSTAILAIAASRTFLLRASRPHDWPILADVSPRQRALDIVLLHQCLLQRVLGLSTESIHKQENLTYVRDAQEAINMVRSGDANVAFLLSPPRVDQITDIAFAGEVLPQKSTDFYPKLLSGLTVYALDEL